MYGVSSQRASLRRVVAVGMVLAIGLVAVPVALAGGATSSSLKGKVKQLESQVAALTQQLQNLQLQPGPQGPQGSQGVQGQQGPAGTIGPDSVALGTQTTGNYVGSVATNPLTGLTGGAAGSEGSALTLGFDYSATPGGNPALGINQTVFGGNGLIFEGLIANNTETLLGPAGDPSADRTISLPDASGALAIDGNLGTQSAIGSPSGNAGLPLIFRVNTTNGSDITLSLSRAMEVVDAWSVATSADGGNWVLKDNGGAPGNTITNTVTVPATDQALTRATSINDANSSVGASFGLFIESLGATLDATIYVLAFPE